MKTYYSDNLKPAPAGTSNAVLQVVKQLPWMKLKLDTHDELLKKEAVARELEARIDRLHYEYGGLKR